MEEFKELALVAWDEGLKKALEKYSENTDNKWDDMAVGLVDKVLKQVLG